MATELGKRLLSRKSKVIDIPDVGTVIARQISADDWLALGRWAGAQTGDVSDMSYAAAVMTFTCFDIQGEKIFDVEDIPQLREALPELYDALLGPVMEVNPRLFKKGDAPGNPPASPPTSDSPSGSPGSSDSPTPA